MSTLLSAELPTKLAHLLKAVDVRAGHDFSGIGLIVTGSPHALPIIPLRPTSILDQPEPVADALARISKLHNEHHDGFHVLTPDLRVALVAQYFSPPIVLEARIDRRKRFGGRYLAALFGSALPGVLATGISSRDFGISIFQDGEERLHRSSADHTTFGKHLGGNGSSLKAEVR